MHKRVQRSLFESFVNSERCKTHFHFLLFLKGLRALLIQKDVKLNIISNVLKMGLRALLIQKDVKRYQDEIKRIRV